LRWGPRRARTIAIAKHRESDYRRFDWDAKAKMWGQGCRNFVRRENPGKSKLLLRVKRFPGARGNNGSKESSKGGSGCRKGELKVVGAGGVKSESSFFKLSSRGEEKKERKGEG